MADLEIEPEALAAAADLWIDTSSRLTSSTSRIAAAPIGGFTSAVRGDASAFLTAWQATVDDTATVAEDVSTNLTSGSIAYAFADEQSREAFHHWLEGGE